MIKQSLTWTALPRSSDGPVQAGTELRLSVFIAPRLWNDDATVTTMPLSDFPDWLDWPAVIGQTTFEVQFEGGPSLPATPENVDLRSDLWQALFKPTTSVKPFVFEDLSSAVIKSFQAATIHDLVQGVYQRFSIDSGYGEGQELPDRDVLVADPDLTAIADDVQPLPEWETPELDRGPTFVGDEEAPEEVEPEPTHEPGGCLWLLLLPIRFLQWLLRKLGLSVFVPSFFFVPPIDDGDLPPASGSAGDGARGDSPPTPAPAPAAAPSSAAKAAFDDLRDYVQPHADASYPLPTAIEVEDTYDFHAMISALGDYPHLMRRLGLVVDLVVTLAGPLPAAQGKVRAVATSPLTLSTDHLTPDTVYALDTESFQARPRNDSDLADGLLQLNDPVRFRVVQTDVAGAGLKLRNTATNVRGAEALGTWAPTAPREAGLPTLQTAGISVVRPKQVFELVRRFTHNYALQSFMTQIDASPLPTFGGAGPAPAPSDELWADDLVRGYRLDVWDDQGNAWHSLCQRVGDYEFLDGSSGAISLTGVEDEGFVQMAATEPLGSPAQRELRVHESLFTWDGWSLVASRPGLTIMPDHATGNAPNTPMTQFKMETAFRAKPGSLPRLRFGWGYRVRARVVDLAGNSRFGPGEPEFANAQPQVTPQFQFNRYEPVAPPPLVMRAPPIEGESTEHAVVRSSIHDQPADIANQQSERHVVPPKTSQQMAERHGSFDGTPHINKDQAAYELASREAASVTERVSFATGDLELIPGTVKHEDAAQNRVYWLQTNDTFEVAFLPDNFARGVLLLRLPGMPSPNAVIHGVNRIAFSGTWPDLETFRLRVTGIPAGAAPAQPAWDATARVLQVELPQGETARVRYCSCFDKADLERMGIWNWVREANPTDLAKLETAATEGRNWLHLPFRELVLVHAVQEPLAIPDIGKLDVVPARPLGATQVTLEGEIDIDAKSTGEVDVRAAWTDPFDDLSKPSYDPSTDVVEREMHVAKIPALDPENDTLDVEGIVQAFDDTKYHRVTYTPTAATRFREYFPPAILSNPEGLVRPTPAEIGTQPAEDSRIELDVENAARPAAVKPLYSVPIFSWSESSNAGVIVHERRGGGLRLYMERPWFSSGAGELLGLVLRPPQVPALSTEWKQMRKYVSEWGMDPLWRAAETAPLAMGDFPDRDDDAQGLSLSELPGLDVDVVGFAPRYDTDRDLWFCDIALDAGRLYFPFIRMALVRFQPISVNHAHLSRVVLSDFAQVLPHRTVQYDTTQIGSANTVGVRVNGPAYYDPDKKPYASPLVMARVEQRLYDTGDELGWEQVSTVLVPVVQHDPYDTVWEGNLPLPTPAPSPMRIVVLEAEVHTIDPQEWERAAARIANEAIPGDGDALRAGAIAGIAGLGYRIVFADAVELP